LKVKKGTERLHKTEQFLPDGHEFNKAYAHFHKHNSYKRGEREKKNLCMRTKTGEN
jgi:hypothetical protein